MSRESKKKTKEWLGKTPNIVLGHDVISEETGSVSGVATHILLGNMAIHTAHKAGRVDAFLAEVYPPLASGQVEVAMSVAGSVKASGTLSLLVASRNREWFWDANSDNEVALASGDAIEMQYTISTALSEDGITPHYIQAKTLITYTE